MDTLRRISLSPLYILFLIVGLVAAACGPTTTAEPTGVATTAPGMDLTAPPSAAAAPLGAEQKIGNLVLVPSKVQNLPSSGSDKPKAGYTYVVVTVQVQNTSQTETMKFDPADLLVVDLANDANISMTTLASLSNALKAQEIKPGAKMEGVIAYEVPQNADKLELMLKAGNNQSIFWKLSG